jgi:hypothetical protein
VPNFDLPAHLLHLEQTAWAAIRAGTLTTSQAAAVQDAITAYAAESGHDRYEVEMGLKRAVRHGENTP